MKRNSGQVNIPIAIVSLAISLLLFIVVLPSWMSKRKRSFRVNLTVSPYTFDSKHFYIDKQDQDIVVYAVVSDQEFDDLSGAATAEADLSDATPGTNRYPVSLYPPKFRKLVTDQNPMATFTLESAKTREVPVSATTSGKLSDPTQIVDTILTDPKRATVEGPASDVARVVSVRATLRLDILDPHSPPQAVALEPVDATDRVVDRVDVHPAQATVTPQFSLSPQQKQVFVEAAFDDHELPPGYMVKNYTVEPKRVIATGSSLALSRVTTVQTAKIDVSKMVGSQTLIVPLKTAGLGLMFSPSSVRVTIVIEPATLNKLTPRTPSNRPNGDAPGAPK